MDDDLKVYDDLDDFEMLVHADKVSVQNWLVHNNLYYDSIPKIVHVYSLLSLDK